MLDCAVQGPARRNFEAEVLAFFTAVVRGTATYQSQPLAADAANMSSNRFQQAISSLTAEGRLRMETKGKQRRFHVAGVGVSAWFRPVREYSPAAGRTRRACLCCGDPFLSTGLHHRLCDTCRHRS